MAAHEAVDGPLTGEEIQAAHRALFGERGRASPAASLHTPYSAGGGCWGPPAWRHWPRHHPRPVTVAAVDSGLVRVSTGQQDLDIFSGVVSLAAAPTAPAAHAA